MDKWYTKLLLILWAALAPVQAVVISVGVLVLADAATGVWAAGKRGEQIKSAALRRTVSKMVIYQIAVITGFLLEQFLLGGAVPVTKIVGGIIGLVEFKSILENANTITGTDLFKEALKRLGSQNDAQSK